MTPKNRLTRRPLWASPAVSLCLFVAVVLGNAQPVQAQSTSWRGFPDSFWSDPLSWNNGVPNSGTGAVFDDHLITHSSVVCGSGNYFVQSITFASGVPRGITISGPGSLVLTDNQGITCTDTNSTHTIEIRLRQNGNMPFDIVTDGEVVASGDIIGSSSLSITKTGGGLLTLSGANTYGGGTTITAGRLVAAGGSAIPDSGTMSIEENGTLQLDSDETIGSLAGSGTISLGGSRMTFGENGLDTEFSGSINGSGGLTKQADCTFTLSGSNTYTGATSVNAGTLILTGTAPGSDVTVASGAKLGGATTIKSLHNSGTFTSGNSIGTTNITGNYTATSSSVTEIEINDAGQSDFVNVTGTATIASGATLKVVPLDEITETREYKFMTAGSYSGEFTVLDTALIDFAAEIRGSDYYLTVTRLPFIDVARTSNQRQIAPYLERTYSGATGDYKSVLDTLAGHSTASEVRHGMDQLDGELYPTLSIANLQAVSNFNRMIADQLRPGLKPLFYPRRGVYRGQCPQCCTWNGWTAGYGLGGNAASDGNAHGYTFSTGGMAVGIDRRLDYATRFGLFYGNGFASTVLDGLADASTIHSNVGGLYLRHRRYDSYWTTIADLGHDDYVSRRNIAFGSINRTAESRHGGWQSTIYNELGHTFYVGPRLGLQPYTALQYIYIRQNGFTETGANSVNLDVSGDDLDSLRTILGGRVIANPGGALFGCNELAFRTHWTHELLDRTTGIIGADFAGVGTPAFAVRGVDLGRDWVTTGTDAVWKHGNHLQLRLSYEITYNARQAYHTGGGSVGLVW